MANEKAIYGENCLLQIEIDSVWYDLFCAKTMSFDWVQEELEVTSINSTRSREYIPFMSSGTATCNGVTKIDNSEGTISLTYLLQEAIRSIIHSLRVYLESQDGDTLQISFNAFITNLNLAGDVTQFSQSAATFRISGDPEISEIINPPAPGELAELYKTLAENATSVTDALLDDVEIFLVEREGVQQDETSGTPVGRQFKYNDSTNSIEFDPNIPGNPGGESIHIIYKPN